MSSKDNTHRAFLQFLRRVIDVPAGYSKEDLMMFRSVASRDYPGIVRIIDEYLRTAERADTGVPLIPSRSSRSGAPLAKTREPGMHLFDMLRDKRLFPSNTDLSDFAGRILPGITRTRFDKMSRGDIAARIIEHLETKDPGTRNQLERSMREAMNSGPEKSADRKSFFSAWERIIKGIDL